MKKNKKQLLYLLVNTFLHIICCGLSFYFNNGSKFALAPGNALLEFFIIHWCAWNSVLTVFYNLKEIRFLSQKNSLVRQERQKKFGLIVAVSNLTSLLGFTFALPILLKKGALDSSIWWINSLVWHFLVLPMSLVYFFQFVKTKKFNLKKKKKLFYLMLPLPVIFFLANLARRFLLVNENYFQAGNKVKFKRFIVWWFKYVENKKFAWLLFWIAFSLCYFWLMAYLLLKVKLKFFKQTDKERKLLPSLWNKQKNS
ncbi:MAG: hypothetical protein MRECE_8c037 [Mycoplasmataceae bacterium CE_OT135]|nr:MAG: hypothetical protein MRECE_8c037 [Mycoplasmataceae bacterium CE_OT135]